MIFRSTSRARRIKFDSEFSKYRRLILPDDANEEVSGGKETVASIHYSGDIERKKIASLSRVASSRSHSRRITKFVLRRQRQPTNYFEQDPI